MLHLYRSLGPGRELCFTIDSSRALSPAEEERLALVLADGFLANTISRTPRLSGERVVELGPRLNFATAWSSNLVSICRAIGLDAVRRVERSRRYLVPEDQDMEAFIQAHHDRMTECIYKKPLESFESGHEPEPVFEIDLMGQGPDVLATIPGISMDQWDREFYYDYFVRKHGRNPTIVEIMDLNNANSEHSRHGYFKGKQVIDGQEMPETLLDMVVSTLTAHPRGSVIAFKDNSSAVRGQRAAVLTPAEPGRPSPLEPVERDLHILFTAETHNFPTGVAPFPGAETGTGGRIRDVQGTGRGGYVVAGTAGYCVGNLRIPGAVMPWEGEHERPGNLASPLEIEIEASNGASDYGNKFGEPLIQGFTRSFDLRLPSGERWAWLKPIMFTGGIGQIDARLTEKNKALKGWRIVQVGGPAYRVGFGGGAASSMLQGDNAEDLDFNAVQRGDAEMEQKMNRVIRACNEMGDKTLIEVIHDQGAGGPGNVLKELVEEAGGRIEIREIRVGDPTMSVLEIYVAEYQERNGFLIRPENMERFRAICAREKVNCEDLGEVTGDLRFVVHDRETGATPVDLELNEVLGNIPQKTFHDQARDPGLAPLDIPADLGVEQALEQVLSLVSVGSKRFLASKVDRAVTGLVARQQCCGPLQLTVADVAIIAQGYSGLSGAATAIGEQPVKMIVDPAAGARMAVGEALTNLVWARVRDLEEVKCSANWMWAPKLPGEGAAMYRACMAMRDAMREIGMAVDGGKDSLSMATRVGEETVKSPRALVISAYGAMEDVTRHVTPALEAPEDDALLLVDLAPGQARLGGTALAQVLGQVGDASPDMDDPALVARAFRAVQDLLDQGLVLAGHDRSDGGLITTLLEMAFSGNCGLEVDIPGDDALAALFGEELGLVLEVRADQADQVRGLLERAGVRAVPIGRATACPRIKVRVGGRLVLERDMAGLRDAWEATSFRLDALQMNPECAAEERRAVFQRPGPRYHIPFEPRVTPPEVLGAEAKPRVAILRDEGSNSDREMTAAFLLAGFEAWDVCMQDLLDGQVDLADFQGLAAVGGFSYADVPESAKGWASTIKFNERLAAMFSEFYQRPDTFSLGVCNGCQLFGLLGWVPWTGIGPEAQPRFVRNRSGRFESRWVTVEVRPSPAIMLRGMEGLRYGIHVDHGEGRLDFPDPAIHAQVLEQGLAPMVFVDDHGAPTETYPFNPNGSPGGLTALCTPDGRHLAMMPHPERCFLPWQAHWLPREMRDVPVTPWIRMFQNAREWCEGQGTGGR